MTRSDNGAPEVERGNTNTEVAILLYDRVTALDAIGPYEVLRGIPGATVKFVAKTPGPITVDSGLLSLVADHSLDEVPDPDVLLIPAVDPIAMREERVTSWIRSAHQTSRWTTSVCGGSLLLGAAGLLEGLRATGHWAMQEALEGFGATYSPDERYVRQGKIITAAGVSAGIDMALYLASEIAGAKEAQTIQLMIEYDPEPPFDAGSPAKAPREVVELAQVRVQELAPEFSSGRGAQN
ncbi:MAG: ThiJ/PfpI family protein [uncultured Rubrobacteraceae bacterium]|uniref:ThiJ/PfpI family protein n=1 Tax=uncultured Rubrobacteraceae bacterium TaxID=349277 RepID=A0A6J4PAR7_9ACTN|nr:MAG: ThiJ/PfpI family protein [uncultured Rubrobacteraceae bacterium]